MLSFVQSAYRYVYKAKPVNTAHKELRLVTIDPSSTPDNLICNLDTYSLSDITNDYKEFLRTANKDASASNNLRAWQGVQQLLDHPEEERYRYTWGDYAALSYVWGDPNNTTTITVNGETARITKNLATALHSLRQSGTFSGRFRLWIDALCINQADNAERSEQVAVMRFFYIRAWSVLGFLGPHADNSPLAFELLNTLAELSRDAEQCELLRTRMLKQDLDHAPGSWLALNRLLLRPYWSRLWIMQEVAIGGARMVLICGDIRITWKAICDAIGVIHSHLWVARHQALAADALHADPEDNRDSDATLLLDHIWKNLFLLTQVQEQQCAHVKFSRLLEMAKSCQCHDERDKVYGMLGLMENRLASVVKPNYNIDVNAVFVQTAQAYITAYNDLELLRDANSWGRPGLPTWVPDWTWSGRSYDSRPDDYYNQQRDDAARRPYHADKSLTFSAPKYVGNSLRCQAVIFDTVDGLGSNAEAESPDDFVQSRGCLSAYGSKEDTAANLAIALYGGRRPWAEHTTSILNLPISMKSAKKQYTALSWTYFEADVFHYHRWTSWYDLNARLRVGGVELREYFTDQIPTDGRPDMSEYWAGYAAWVRTALAGCRRLMVTSAGRIGWAPCVKSAAAADGVEVQRGDCLAVIPGCSSPMLLRRCQKVGEYQVVAEAYVQGMMEGEISGMLDNGRYELDWIVLK